METLREKLRRLRDKMVRPVLGYTNGVAVAVMADRVIQFPSEESAQFFMNAYDVIPQLLDLVDELERRQDPALVDKMVSDIAALQRELAAANEQRIALENLLVLEVTARTKAQLQARVGRTIAVKFIGMCKRAEALQSELDAVRKP